MPNLYIDLAMNLHACLFGVMYDEDDRSFAILLGPFAVIIGREI